MSQALRAGLARLDTTTRITLAVLALASGVYTYLGVRELLDGSAMLVFFAAIIYSAAVSIGIYAFWSFLMRFMPHVRDAVSRFLLLIAMGLGAVMIVAMSSWLNAAALAGGAALEQHLATTAEEYQHRPDAAHSNAPAAPCPLPDIAPASSPFRRLAPDEAAGRAPTRTPPSLPAPTPLLAPVTTLLSPSRPHLALLCPEPQSGQGPQRLPERIRKPRRRSWPEGWDSFTRSR